MDCVSRDVAGEILDVRTLSQILDAYKEPSKARSSFELVITVLPFMCLWAIAWIAYALGYWWICPLIAVPAAGFLLRLFVIQHDCGHGIFYRHKQLNDWTGRIIGVLTMTPYGFWRRTHAIHHATCGNLERRGIGDIDTLTIREYMARSRWGKLKYRIYRHPIVLFGLAPTYLFLLQHRLPIGLMRKGWSPWVSTQANNLAILLVILTLIGAVGAKAFLIIQLPTLVLAASVGVWLFYVQHQFENTFWRQGADWSFHDAAFHGSSYYDLPMVLRWFTANIGIHHVHHLSSRIPYYRLSRVLRDHAALRNVGRLTLIGSLRCIPLALWDEERSRLVSFRTAMAASRAGGG